MNRHRDIHFPHALVSQLTNQLGYLGPTLLNAPEFLGFDKTVWGFT